MPVESATGIRQRFPEIYQELREVASRMLRKQPPLTFTPSDLTHEAFVKLCGEETRRRASDRSELADKPYAFFKACFGAACRDLLANHARSRGAERRRADQLREPLSNSIPNAAVEPPDLPALFDALDTLAVQEPLLAHIAELRLIGGLTIAECAETLGVPPRTIDRKWAFARAWLQTRLR